MRAPPALLHEASLRNGAYGSGTAIDTMACDPYCYLGTVGHGGAPHALGIVDSADGVTYTSTESDDRSSALINWVLPGADSIAFRTSGTVSFLFGADRATFVSGSILGDNPGFDAFAHGQGTFGATAGRVANDPGDADDQVSIGGSSWHSNEWFYRTPVTLELDTWYELGYAWGGPGDTFELWVDGGLCSGDSQGALPWGFSGSATNFGIGDNHMRGVDVYGSASGATFADISIWSEYRSQGDTTGEGDTDADGLGNACDDNDDNDGCTDAQEQGSDETLGGQRDRLSFWDFFDTPDGSNVRDQVIDVGDIFRVVDRFGTFGDENIDPLSAPGPTGYHTAFDRTPPAPGGDPWDAGAVDGTVDSSDIFAAVTQFGHSCA